jgi:hypothetical protein
VLPALGGLTRAGEIEKLKKALDYKIASPMLLQMDN